MLYSGKLWSNVGPSPNYHGERKSRPMSAAIEALAVYITFVVDSDNVVDVLL